MLTKTETWMDRAACRDVEDRSVFFTNEKNRFKHPDKAFAYCLVCTERDHCQDYAVLTGSEDGIWGMLFPKDIKELNDFAMSHDPYEAFGAIADSVAWLLCEEGLAYEQA